VACAERTGLVPEGRKALFAMIPRIVPGISMPASAWSLHSRLQEDTIDIGDLPLSRVLVIKDANYPWLLLVPRREGAVEIIDLGEVEQAQLMTEISRVARALKEVSRCDKLNIAALGNAVPQLHVHIIARRTSDAAWPRPVWGVAPPLAHDAEEVQTFISALRRKIWLG
jgi:diadenosine tetraphosphate (Ap4A) HIT family hydrolase